MSPPPRRLDPSGKRLRNAKRNRWHVGPEGSRSRAQRLAEKGHADDDGLVPGSEVRGGLVGRAPRRRCSRSPRRVAASSTGGDRPVYRCIHKVTSRFPEQRGPLRTAIYAQFLRFTAVARCTSCARSTVSARQQACSLVGGPARHERRVDYLQCSVARQPRPRPPAAENVGQVDADPYEHLLEKERWGCVERHARTFSREGPDLRAPLLHGRPHAGRGRRGDHAPMYRLLEETYQTLAASPVLSGLPHHGQATRRTGRRSATPRGASSPMGRGSPGRETRHSRFGQLGLLQIVLGPVLTSRFVPRRRSPFGPDRDRRDPARGSLRRGLLGTGTPSRRAVQTDALGNGRAASCRLDLGIAPSRCVPRGCRCPPTRRGRVEQAFCGREEQPFQSHRQAARASRPPRPAVLLVLRPVGRRRRGADGIVGKRASKRVRRRLAPRRARGAHGAARRGPRARGWRSRHRGARLRAPCRQSRAPGRGRSRVVRRAPLGPRARPQFAARRHRRRPRPRPRRPRRYVGDAGARGARRRPDGRIATALFVPRPGRPAALRAVAGWISRDAPARALVARDAGRARAARTRRVGDQRRCSTRLPPRSRRAVTAELAHALERLRAHPRRSGPRRSGASRSLQPRVARGGAPRPARRSEDDATISRRSTRGSPRASVSERARGATGERKHPRVADNGGGARGGAIVAATAAAPSGGRRPAPHRVAGGEHHFAAKRRRRRPISTRGGLASPRGPGVGPGRARRRFRFVVGTLVVASVAGDEDKLAGLARSRRARNSTRKACSVAQPAGTRRSRSATFDSPRADGRVGSRIARVSDSMEGPDDDGAGTRRRLASKRPCDPVRAAHDRRRLGELTSPRACVRAHARSTTERSRSSSRVRSARARRARSTARARARRPRQPSSPAG